jgi:2'-5' RNA ligase
MLRPNFFFGFPIAGNFLLALPKRPTSFRRFHVDDVHMTLAFLGACGEEAALRALRALDDRLAVSPIGPMKLSLAEVVPMGGSRRKYSALSALLNEGQREAAACITAYRDVLTETATGRKETRLATPHVTLARPRQRATDNDRAAGLAWARSVNVREVRASLCRVALYTWSEGKERRDRLFRVVAERVTASE